MKRTIQPKSTHKRPTAARMVEIPNRRDAAEIAKLRDAVSKARLQSNTLMHELAELKQKHANASSALASVTTELEEVKRWLLGNEKPRRKGYEAFK